ncbi:MAG: AurF N-oxygenase family protein [Acidimicrobiales bacterium]
MRPSLDDELRGDAASDDAFYTMAARLSRLSVDKHFDAYGDVDWDAPDMRVDATDARWTSMLDSVVDTDWYRGLTPEARARYGLYRWAAAMKTGWHFENFLQRGLLAWVMRLPNGSPEFRYAHHEIVEESQHTLMFQEFVNRSALPVRGMPWWARAAAELVVRPLALWAPATFFFLVLAGEEPADHVQRQELRHGTPHPLTERIFRIHVTEEARHISFARSYLRRRVPRLRWLQRRLLAVQVPVIMGIMARLILVPPADLRRHVGLPRNVCRRAMHSPAGRRVLVDSVRNVRELCDELGLMTPSSRRTWRAWGLWPAR